MGIRMHTGQSVLCHADGSSYGWEALCVDFDLAVQGAPFDNVYDKLHAQIGLYVDGVMALPAGEQARLLRRRAPLRS